MYRVMPHDPDPDGTYHSVPGVSADDKAEPFEIVFKVPRLEFIWHEFCDDVEDNHQPRYHKIEILMKTLNAHIQDCEDHYTIVLPRYVADEMRQQAAQDMDLGPIDIHPAVDITRGGGGAGVQQSAPGCSVYLSYSPDNAVGKSIANYVKTAVLERHGAACVVLTPDDGKFNYVDFAALIQERSHFIVCASPSYFEDIESRNSRPSQELEAAVAALPSQRIMCIYPEAMGIVSQQHVQQNVAPDLRKAFMMKPMVFFENMGHLELFEANLCRFLGIEHNSELLQLPVAPFLDSVGLGSFICGVYTLLGCSRIDHFVGLSQQDLAKLGMDNQQATRLLEAVDHALLVELLESVDCSVLAKRLTEQHNKHTDARPATAAKILVSKINHLGNLSEAHIKELCGGDSAVLEHTLAAVGRLQRLSVPERMALVCEEHFASKEQSVKTLVARLWSPGAPQRMRAQAAELIRRKTLSTAGLEETRHVAGLESLIKLVEEGPESEKIAALWALRNFCLVDMFRARMSGMGVVDICLRLLETSHMSKGVQHAAACVLQMLTIADVDTIKAISEQHALSKIVSFLYGKHRGLKVAALAIISNLAVTDDNRTACSKLRFVPRLVALLDSSVPADVSSMAVSALAQLVLLDVNRLKCWRCGGVERLKAIVDRNLPRVSEVARQAVQVLMAGPRIHPAARFATASGRKLNASEMRAAIQRLNCQDTYLSGVNTSMAGFLSASPVVIAALTKRPQSSPIKRNARTRGIDAHIDRSAFSPPRPESASPVPRPQTAAPSECISEWPVQDLAPLPQRDIFASGLLPAGAVTTSEFMRRLTWKQQCELCKRLTVHNAPLTGGSNVRPPSGIARSLSTWKKRPSVPVMPRGPRANATRQTGLFYSAKAAKAYRTELGKLIHPDAIVQGDARRLSIWPTA